MTETSSPTEPSSARRRGPVRRLVLVFAILSVAGIGWMFGIRGDSARGNSRERDFWVLCQPGFAADQRERAFRNLVAAGNKEWRSAELRGLNLASVSMKGADLQYAPFVKTHLVAANFEGALLCRGALELCDCTHAQFTQANLTEARLLNAVLKGASFRRAVLCASTLEQAQAENADFESADLSDADCKMANLTGAKLVGANLSGAKLESTVLKGADLTLTRLDGANLTDTDFTNANWWAARGLTSKQLTYLKKKFPPTADADAALKADFARWAEVPVPH
jgi:uncharacterized protein YjbI with pentapeptide repeats